MDPAQLQFRWLAGRKLTAAELGVSADLIPVFSGDTDVSILPASLALAVADAPIPVILAPEPSDTPAAASPLDVEAADFTFPDESGVTNTTWNLRKASDESTIWESRHDHTHLFTITVPALTMAAATQYLLSVRFFGHGHLTTRRASVTFTTAA